MKKRLLSILTTLIALPVMAQLSGNGYYRVQNFTSTRYIIMIDNKTQGADVQANRFDIHALKSIKPFATIADDPATIFWIEPAGNNQYNLKAQGSDAYKSLGRYLTITPQQEVDGVQTYYATGIYEGMEFRLSDQSGSKNVGTLSLNGNLKNWKIMPVSTTSNDNYFGVKAEFTAQGQRYTSLYASFPFTFYSQGMKAYVVTKVDGDMAVWQELEGKVAASTPVIIACPADDAASNRINIEMQDGQKPQANVLKGVWFNASPYITGEGAELNFHYNVTPYDPATMRLLGVTKAGRLGYIKYSADEVKYIPRNRAYITVPASAPDEITLVTQAEYEAAVAQDAVTVTANDKTRIYGDANPDFDYVVEGPADIKGTPDIACAATTASLVGTYPIVVTRGTVTNRSFTAKNGTLTVTPALLGVQARSYTIKQNEQLPVFEADITGFKNNETADVLTTQPVITCDAPADRTPGTYTITPSGAAAQNYTFNYYAGTLTILPADPITIMADNLSRVYGDVNPQLTWQMIGGTIAGQPDIVCEANVQSPVGTYAITVSKGTLDYPNLVFQAGTLTVTPATLTVAVADTSRYEGEDNPEFVITYEGFRNADNESVLIQKPVATTTATKESTPGVYPITLSGGEAHDYVFVYRNGSLTVQQVDAIKTVAFLQPVDVYTLTGRLVRSQAVTTEGLPRGIYIAAGRKIVVR